MLNGLNSLNSVTQSGSPENAITIPSTLSTSTFLNTLPSTNINSKALPTIPIHHIKPSNEQIASRERITEESNSMDTIEVYIAYSAKKKYKPVALKIKSVLGELPDKFRIIRNIIGDPLQELPTLNPNPPLYTPTGRYTQERKDLFDKLNPGFLLPAERDLLHHFMMLHQDGFAWDNSERGHFREDFFPPIDIPVVPHTPWVQRNIPIPPGLHKEVCRLIQEKIDAGVFEPSNSSYRSRWFCVVKKDGKSLRIVQSLEPLNQVTIRHSGVPPLSEQLAEHFAGRACNSMMDLFVGYDE